MLLREIATGRRLFERFIDWAVIEGMDVVDSLYSGYGEGAPQGKGPSQARIASEGNAYLEAEFSKLDSIISAEIVVEKGGGQ
ncbi:MAG: hypothetical protein K8R59_14145 [Thermoanaerobaculales bacterium]|nr:hypothetical protein [Thermoanaerobaculales bacterium]